VCQMQAKWGNIYIYNSWQNTVSPQHPNSHLLQWMTCGRQRWRWPSFVHWLLHGRKSQFRPQNRRPQFSAVFWNVIFHKDINGVTGVMAEKVKSEFSRNCLFCPADQSLLMLIPAYLYRNQQATALHYDTQREVMYPHTRRTWNDDFTNS